MFHKELDRLERNIKKLKVILELRENQLDKYSNNIAGLRINQLIDRLEKLIAELESEGQQYDKRYG